MAVKKVRKFGTGGDAGGSTIESGDTTYTDSTETDTGADYASDPNLDLGGNQDNTGGSSVDWGALASALSVPGYDQANSSGSNLAWTQAAQQLLASGNGAQRQQQQAPQGELGVLGSVLKGLGLSNGKKGLAGIDFADPNVMTRLGKVLTAGAGIYDAITGGNKPPAPKTVAEVQAMFASPFSGFTPAGKAAYDHMNSTPYASRAPRQLKAYANGGGVDDNNPQFFSAGALAQHYTDGGASGGGQDDIIPARLAPKEYVLDADTMASLGDGNPDHGAAKMDAWRANLRTHKRSAPAHSIPPKAKSVDAYMPKGKK